MTGFRVSAKTHRPGTVLILTMIVTFALAATVLVLGRSMSVEMQASANLAASVQASAVERGAEQYLIALLTQESQQALTLPEESFAGIPVGDGWFWVLRPDYGDPSLPLFGLVDEGSKLNVNDDDANYDRLMLLPGMREDIAAAIVDWRDEDETPEPGGAENEYYLSLPEPYYCKNERFETLEELRLVRGVTYEWLYGIGQRPPLGVRSSSFISSNVSGDELLARGLADYLTIYSRENNRDKIRINGRNNRTQLRQLLERELPQRAAAIMSALGNDSLVDMYDFYDRAQLKPDEIAILETRLTTLDRTVRGRINVNTAPREVLLTVPNFESDDVEKIIGQRSDASGTSLAWLPDLIGTKKAVGLEKYITAQTSQYSADILAVSGNGRSFKRVKIVIDSRRGTPQIVYRRDMTERGWPMERQVLASLRAGQGPGNSVLTSGQTSLAMRGRQ
jgi:DNA uptake protein ComE-like DNA-binding protein